MKIACPFCGQDWLVGVRLVSVEGVAVLCRECDSLWPRGANPLTSEPEQLYPFMEARGFKKLFNTGHIEYLGPWPGQLSIPTVIQIALDTGVWRDPGPDALHELLAAAHELPTMQLFETTDEMCRVAEQVHSGGYVELPQFCMVHSAANRRSPDDPRLVFPRALFIAGSRIPGDDVFVVVEDVAAVNPQILVLDWARPIPERWVRLCSLAAFCDALATANRSALC